MVWAGNPGIDYFIAVSLGKVSGVSIVHKFGHAETVGTAKTDIWDGAAGGASVNSYNFPTATITDATISSSSADDDVAGTGALTVEVFGLDSSYVEQSETVILTGRTPVALAKDYIRFNRMIVMTAGSGGTAAGDIYLSNSAAHTLGIPNDLTKLYAKILIGENQTLMAIYTVPAGKSAFLVAYSFGTNKDKAVEYWLRIRPFGEVFQTKIRAMLYRRTDPNTPLIVPSTAITEKSDIVATSLVDVTTADLSATFTLILVEN